MVVGWSAGIWACDLVVVQQKGELVSSGAKGPAAPTAIAQLWAQAAHDLRQPVQAALLLTKMIDGTSTQPETRRAIRHIGTSLRSLYGMLEFLTVLSRLEAGLQGVSLRNCQLADVLAATLREMTKVAGKHGITLQTRNLRGLVRTNPQLLTIAAKSLLLHAIKFGNGEEISACCRRRGDQVGFEIHFRGTSDPATEKCAFFELSTLSGGARASELGVGLALVEQLCRRLDHSLQQAITPPAARLLVIWLPRAATGT
jgi:signal transduction histidine kinase